MDHVTQPSSFADISTFLTGNQQILLYHEIDIDSIQINNF